MPHQVLQLSSQGFYVFADDAGAYGEGLPGLTISVSLSKSGGPFLSVAPAKTDLGGGLYWIAPLAAHRDTLGEIAWRFTATGAVIAPRIERVVAVNDQLAAWGANTVAPDNAGITAARTAAEAAALLLDALTELDEDQLRLTAKALELADVDLQPVLDAMGLVTGPDVRTLKIFAHDGDDPETGEPVAGLQLRVAGRTLKTDTAGLAEIRLNPGTYTVRGISPFGFDDLDTITITMDGSDQILPIAMTRIIVVDPPASAAICRVTLRVADEADQPWVGVPVTTRLVSGPVVGATLHGDRFTPGATDDDGLVTLDRIRGQAYEFTATKPDGTKITIRRRLPDLPNADLSMTIPMGLG